MVPGRVQRLQPLQFSQLALPSLEFPFDLVNFWFRSLDFELLRTTKTAWDFLGVNFWSRDFFGSWILAPFNHPHHLKSWVPQWDCLQHGQTRWAKIANPCITCYNSTGRYTLRITDHFLFKPGNFSKSQVWILYLWLPAWGFLIKVPKINFSKTFWTFPIPSLKR